MVLWTPPPFSPSLLKASDPAVNEGSLVCRVRFGGVTFLFMGDAGGDVEARLVEAYGPLLRADVLKVGHHGSATASTRAFLNAVAPSVALVSVGRGNRFGHPATIVLDRLDSLGVEVHRTDEEGAVVLESDGRTVSLVSWR
jgi:beta-lactamase superfamily II metal-dependent hydrolase